jgi:hypothetical protein
MIRSKREIRKRELNDLIADLSVQLEKAQKELKQIENKERAEEMNNAPYLKPSSNKKPEKIGKYRI